MFGLDRGNFRRYWRYLATGCALAMAPTIAFGAEDLLHQYRLAVEHDPRLLAAAANRGASNERLSQTEAGFFPTVAASAVRNRNHPHVETGDYIYSQPPGDARFYSKEYRLSLSQPIYRADLFASHRVAGADLRAAEAQFAATAQELMVRVTQAYFDVLASEDAVALAAAEREAMAHQRDSAQARLRAGLAPITDVHDAEAAYQSALSQEIEAANQRADKRAALAEITGQQPAVLAVLGERLPHVLPEPADIARWAETAATQNPSILAASAAVESARESISQQRAGHYPTLDLVGSRIRNDADASITGPSVLSDNRVVGLQLNVPLFQGGMINARTREAAYRYDTTSQELEARKRNVERITRSSFLAASGGVTKIAALQLSVAAAGESRKAKAEGYKAGLHTALDVLNATRDLFRTRRDLAQARYTYVLSLLQLKQAAGTLQEEDLRTLNGWLQADATVTDTK